MRTPRSLALTLTLLLVAAPALAQQSAAPEQATPPAAGEMMRDGGMMGQGGDMMMGRGGRMMMGRGGGMMGRGGGMMRGRGGMMMPMMGFTRHVEGWLAFLKTELKIAAPQEKAWDAFADAVRANASAMRETGMPMMGRMGRMGRWRNGETLPQRLAAREQMLEAALANVKRLKAAADPLYAVLSDEQKRTAEELVGAMRTRMY
jgi:hypothetical protein